VPLLLDFLTALVFLVLFRIFFGRRRNDGN
jgi:hypothetical protein